MSRSIGKVFGTGPYLTSGFDTNTDFAGRDVSKMTTEELQRRIAEMFPQASVPQQIQDFAATNTTGINLQNNLTNNTGTYTTESAWGYSNNTQTPMYQQIGEPYTTSNQEFSYSLTSNYQPYIFSEEMRNRLGLLESGNDYSKVNSDGGGIGALGKYQIRRDGFKDAGYINNNNQWAGKNNINSTNDYLNNEQLQEKALDDFMTA